MGGFFSKLFDGLFQKKVRILILGLDSAGKTTILYKLQIGEVVETTPTVGFNMETVERESVKFQAFDLGGQESLRPYWRYYYNEIDGVIYVVDSSDRDRLRTSVKEFQLMLKEEELKNAAILVYANKQDLPDPLSPTEITQALNLTEIKDQPWSIFKCSAIDKEDEGIEQGMEWLANTLKKND
ncbi:adp-ribosylation factor [Anaeramoeba flamelloides]|uniref:Adp-ribosylation factor n=1 Tax=Anaeramoeba flamelloides TaxID=1746091 RepID=A0AAV7Z360_9EUKA|nr:adp-ribosylation factor [Anaeramoeba flamelloides]